MAQIMPAEILDLRSLKRAIAGFGAHLRNRFARKAKHMRWVNPFLLLHDRECLRVQGDGNRLTRFGLIRMDPTKLAFLIRPATIGDP